MNDKELEQDLEQTVVLPEVSPQGTPNTEPQQPAVPEATEPEIHSEEDGFDLDDIMKEFSPGLEKLSAEPDAESVNPDYLSEDTVRLDIPESQHPSSVSGDTIRLENIEALAKEAAAAQAAAQAAAPEPQSPEPYSGQWQPEFEQPIAEYVPPQPIIFHPRARLRELKRKLVAGPERRYYLLNERGLGKLQAAIFLSFLVVVLSAGATALYELGIVQPERLKLMIFGQFFAMLLSALLGCYQLMEGAGDLMRGRFTLNSMLIFTFLACCVDGVFCLRELRIPCCAAFSLQVTMSLWGAYHRRGTEMAMMDTLRKANHLHDIRRSKDYHDGCDALLRSEGRLEDFMDNYAVPSAPDKVFSWYALAALIASIGIGVAAGVLHSSISFGIQVLSVSLLAAVPVTSFVALTRPASILQRQLHKLGTVLCGWQGVTGMSRRVLFPIRHDDLFPIGACKLNGVKFYGSRDPDEIVAYCTALVSADGGGLVPLFDYLLSSRSGRHYPVDGLRGYPGGIGGDVCGEPVLMGTLTCLKDMGVEIPEGTSVSQAVYAAIDGELCGVFAVTYAKSKGSASAMRTLCTCHGLRPALISEDFMLTESFIRTRFNVNPRRVCMPQRAERAELSAIQADPDTPSLALITTDAFVSFAFAVTGARALRNTSWVGTVVQIFGGVVGLGMMLTLAILGAGHLLTPANLFLYELVWIIPGLIITEWTRSI